MNEERAVSYLPECRHEVSDNRIQCAQRQDADNCNDLGLSGHQLLEVSSFLEYHQRPVDDTQVLCRKDRSAAEQRDGPLNAA